MTPEEMHGMLIGEEGMLIVEEGINKRFIPFILCRICNTQQVSKLYLYFKIYIVYKYTKLILNVRYLLKSYRRDAKFVDSQGCYCLAID
jgi:hypothetical protein